MSSASVNSTLDLQHSVGGSACPTGLRSAPARRPRPEMVPERGSRLGTPFEQLTTAKRYP